MANPEHLKILKQGVEVWNKWRRDYPDAKPDLSGADLNGCDFGDINFWEVVLIGADLSQTNFDSAQLSGANLKSCNLQLALIANSQLFGTNLSESYLVESALIQCDCKFSCFDHANLTKTDFLDSNLESAKLTNALLLETSLQNTILIKTDLSYSTLQDCNIYGISAWDIKKDGLIQKDLIITPPGEPEITVDDLDVAQFIYLMLNNQKIRDVIETITSKAVLILGRFTPERKALLDAIKDELRLRNYLPIVFDFENASNKSIDETINLLARMSRFVIADITDAKSIPQELRGFVPDNPSIPIVPLIWKAQREYAMFDYFRKFPWVLPLHEYESPDALLKNIIPVIIEPVEKKVKELNVK